MVHFYILNQAGQVLTTASVKLPKVKVTGYVTAVDGVSQQAVYDSTVFIKLGDITREEPDQQATQFRYYVLT
ncbi:hypothetical protein [Spirosoma endophyticum]|uniref:Uncharacterized protein n=1 Tax=Spirosoma endophyticum TaxID=662367 RepID=A0A1I2IGU9_9BACT|nr:hypothetical protein [Spirosoma endophyticum]SFF41464.1 hypothetical protein SAMN05216167_1822 [Spirosoma endophyticum]